MRKLTADYVFTVAGSPIQRGVVVLDDLMRVIDVGTREQHAPDSLEYYDGILTPGFVNAHCHLELSHLKGKAPTGTGLIPFIHAVVSSRGDDMPTILEAIEAADKEMQTNGIVAVGDICNKTDTAFVKKQSALYYYSFVEMFDFLQDDKALQCFNQYKKVFDEQTEGDGQKKSCVPHAPYSVSKQLFRYIQDANRLDETIKTVSIHNQETVHEDNLFMYGTGGFPDFYKGFGVSLHDFVPTKKSSIHYALEGLDPAHRTIFVHNTCTTLADIMAATAWSHNIFWVTCPNANLYIENRLPCYKHFIESNAKVAIGTDSLTSNWQLSILEEMKTIMRYQSFINFETLLQWATINGAMSLGLEENIGTIEVGKSPGLNLIYDINVNSFALNQNTKVKAICGANRFL